MQHLSMSEWVKGYFTGAFLAFLGTVAVALVIASTLEGPKVKVVYTTKRPKATVWCLTSFLDQEPWSTEAEIEWPNAKTNSGMILKEGEWFDSKEAAQEQRNRELQSRIKFHQDQIEMLQSYVK